MAVDTASKRFAMMGLGMMMVVLTVVDAEISAEDRVNYLGLYNGFALNELVVSNYDPLSPFTMQRDVIKFIMGGKP